MFRHVYENPGEWYHFSDIELPFGLKRAKLAWDSGHNKEVGITIRKGITLNLLHCLLAFTLDNCHLCNFTPPITSGGDIYDRVQLLQTFMVLFAECQQSGVFLRFAEQNF